MALKTMGRPDFFSNSTYSPDSQFKVVPGFPANLLLTRSTPFQVAVHRGA
jgi:hypothetical protein